MNGYVAVHNVAIGSEEIEQAAVGGSEGQISHPELDVGRRATGASSGISVGASAAGVVPTRVSTSATAIVAAAAGSASGRRAISLGTGFADANGASLEFGLIHLHNGILGILA